MLQTFWVRLRLRQCYMTESFEAPSRGRINTRKSCNDGCSHFQCVFLRGKKIKSDRFQAPGGLGSILSSRFHPVSHLLYLWQLPASLHRLPEARPNSTDRCSQESPFAARQHGASLVISCCLHCVMYAYNRPLYAAASARGTHSTVGVLLFCFCSFLTLGVSNFQKSTRECEC